MPTASPFCLSQLPTAGSSDQNHLPIPSLLIWEDKPAPLLDQSRGAGLLLFVVVCCCFRDPTSGTNVQFLIPGHNKLRLSPDAGGQGDWSGNDILSVGSQRAGLQIMFVQDSQCTPEGAWGS